MEFAGHDMMTDTSGNGTGTGLGYRICGRLVLGVFRFYLVDFMGILTPGAWSIITAGCTALYYK